MTDRKIDKALYGPSVTEVALGAILGAILGVFVACVYLAFKPVKVVREPVKEPVVGMVYYQPGTSDSGRARAWQSKAKMFVAGRTVEADENELNAWASDTFGKTAAATALGADGTPAKKPEQGFLSADAPNFRITDGTMQIGYNCKVNYFGVGTTVVVHATGRFQRTSEGYVFDADEFYFGSCPIQKLFGVAAPIESKLSSLYNIPDEVKAAWAKLAGVTLQGRTLKLVAQ